MRACSFALLCVFAVVGSAAAQSPPPPPPPWAIGPSGFAPMPPGTRPAPPPGWTVPVPEGAVLLDLDEEQFITHWVLAYDVIAGGITTI